MGKVGKSKNLALKGIKEEIEDSEDECRHVMAFATTTDKVIMESASDNEDSSDDEVLKKMTLQEAYDKLCIELIKFEKTSHLCRKELNEVKSEKTDLLVKLDETTRLVETLVVENTSLEEKIKKHLVTKP